MMGIFNDNKVETISADGTNETFQLGSTEPHDHYNRTTQTRF